MKPVFAALTYLDGDTPPRFAFRLFSRDVRSQEIKVRPGSGDVVEWTVEWPAGTAKKTSATGGGLAVDPRTRVVRHPLTEADLAAVEVGKPVPFSIQIVNGDGVRRTYVTGTLTKEARRS